MITVDEYARDTSEDSILEIGPCVVWIQIVDPHGQEYLLDKYIQS